MTEGTIVKTFTGRHIDLSKVVAISDACIMDYSNGFFVGFAIHVQLLDRPIEYGRRLKDDELNFIGYSPVPIMSETSNKPLAAERLQIDIDKLIEQWKEINSR